MSYDDHNAYYFCSKHQVATACGADRFCNVCRNIEPELIALRAENRGLFSEVDRLRSFIATLQEPRLVATGAIIDKPAPPEGT